MAHWSSPARPQPSAERRCICNVCGQTNGLYHTNRPCWNCGQGEFISTGFYHVSDCPNCMGNEGLVCNVCWGMGFTAIPTEDQDDMDRACLFHCMCINPSKRWEELMKEGMQRWTQGDREET